jgi:hypothetical protein
VCHTLNPRLSDADITYIADHGQVIDRSFCQSFCRFLLSISLVFNKWEVFWVQVFGGRCM